MSEDKKCTLHGSAPDGVTSGAPRPINPATGIHEDYYVICEEDRKKGFIRPVRTAYRHVGPPGPKFQLRDLTDEERQRYNEFGYVKYEEYPEGSHGCVVGRFWTQHDLDRIGTGCGHQTIMHQAFAETYARNPGFYGATFCAYCRVHLPVGEAGEFVWPDGTRVGT